MPTRLGRIEGGLVGLLVGDALGVPYEFSPPKPSPPPRRSGRTRGRPRGPGPTTAPRRSRCSPACSIAGGSTRRIWAATCSNGYDLGRFAVDRRVFDVGIQTSTALRALRAGIPALEAGPAEERTNGNGSLMRVLPLALWHLGSDPELVADARLQSRATHGHPRSQAGCALYCLWARRVMEGGEDPWREAVAALRGLWSDDPASLAVLEESIRPDDPPGGRGGGYVVDCLHSARWAVEAGPYEEIVKAAVALGNDTDTTACVAGGIAGLRDGVSAIPERWRRVLRGREWLDPLLGTLLERHSARPAP